MDKEKPSTSAGKQEPVDDEPPEKFKSTNDLLKSAKSGKDKENAKQQDKLTQSKGRAQVTATTAMSIVNVALLKSVLDDGPAGSRYYYVSLVLISLSLGLQIIAGIMSLMIEAANGYLTKYGGNFCEDMEDYCCMCRCVRNKRVPQNTREKQHLIPSSGSTELTSWEESTCGLESGSLIAETTDDPLCDCCPFIITNRIYAHSELDTLQKYNKWSMNEMNNELKTIRSQDELTYQRGVVEKAKKQMQTLTELMNKPDAQKEDINRQMEDLKALLATALERKNNCEGALRNAKMVKEQGKRLEEYVASIKKNRMLRLTSFWQQILNYMFYAIFIMNAFITGFGLGSAPNVSSGLVPVQNATQN